MGRSTFTSTPTLTPDELLDDELLEEELLEEELLDELLEVRPLDELLEELLDELLEELLAGFELLPVQPANNTAAASAKVKVFIIGTFIVVFNLFQYSTAGYYRVCNVLGCAD